MRIPLIPHLTTFAAAEENRKAAAEWLVKHGIQPTPEKFRRVAAGVEGAIEKSAAVQILMALLRPLTAFFTHVDYEEIVMNRPCEVWVKNRRPRDGRVWEAIEVSELTYDRMRKIVTSVANLYEKPFGPDSQPAIYATLPGGHRFTAAMGTVVDYDGSDPRGGVALAIRQAVRGDIAKVDYASYGLIDGENIKPLSHISPETEAAFDGKGRLKAALAREQHILISGGTSTGKTTLLDRMIADLPSTLRIITTEDTRELRLGQPNHLHIVLPRTESTIKFDEKSAEDLVKRLTPDIIIAGELSNRNAALAFALTGSGHGAMMTTIHAESPDLAIERYAQLIGTRANMEPDRLARSIASKYLVIQLSRDAYNRRRVNEIREPIDRIGKPVGRSGMMQ